MSFNPGDAASADSGIFGLPHSAQASKVIIIPVPWEATTSYGGGTAKAPRRIFDASKQVDLYDLETKKAYEAGIHMEEIHLEVAGWGQQAKYHAQKIVNVGGAVKGKPDLERSLLEANELGGRLNQWVYRQTKSWLDKGKIVGVLGGDHSVPFGAIQAVAEKHEEYGILHVDAHADLRNAYEGFKWSHASIMFNVMNSEFAPKKLVQVGIRDFSEDEYDLIQSNSRIETYFDLNVKYRTQQSTEGWYDICQEMVAHLPEHVYVSFDIDGLEASLCPGTGTPVPGGLNFSEALMLLKVLVESKRKIIGFDLNEVSCGKDDSEWNANVGARLLYKLCCWSILSQ